MGGDDDPEENVRIAAENHLLLEERSKIAAEADSLQKENDKLRLQIKQLHKQRASVQEQKQAIKPQGALTTNPQAGDGQNAEAEEENEDEDVEFFCNAIKRHSMQDGGTHRSGILEKHRRWLRQGLNRRV